MINKITKALFEGAKDAAKCDPENEIAIILIGYGVRYGVKKLKEYLDSKDKDFDDPDPDIYDNLPWWLKW